MRIRGVRKSFGRVDVLRGLDLEIRGGEVFVLLGPSGCGKTTLLRAIAGLEPLDAGSIEIGGRVVSSPTANVHPSDRGVGFVFQDLALWPHLTATEHLAFVLGRQNGAARRERVDRLLDEMRLAPLAGRFPHELSGGERQRLALARALAPEPRLVLLDEPLAASDPRVAREMRVLLANLNRERGITLVYVTHGQEEAFELGHRIGVMHRGVLEQVGEPEAVHDRPETDFVASFVGSGTLLDGRYDAASGTFDCALGELPADAVDSSGALTGLLRERDVVCRESGNGRDAVVLGSIYRGGHFSTRVDTGGAEILALDDRRRNPGDRVWLLYEGRVWCVRKTEGGA